MFGTMCDLDMDASCSGRHPCETCPLELTPKPPRSLKEVKQEKKIVQMFLDHAKKLDW